MRSEPVLPLQTALIGGYAMSYTEYGSGTPLVLVHGSLSDCRYWKSQMAPLAMTSTGASSEARRKLMDLAICATSQPRPAAASAEVLPD